MMVWCSGGGFAAAALSRRGGRGRGEPRAGTIPARARNARATVDRRARATPGLRQTLDRGAAV